MPNNLLIVTYYLCLKLNVIFNALDAIIIVFFYIYISPNVFLNVRKRNEVRIDG